MSMLEVLGRPRRAAPGRRSCDLLQGAIAPSPSESAGRARPGRRRPPAACPGRCRSGRRRAGVLKEKLRGSGSGTLVPSYGAGEVLAHETSSSPPSTGDQQDASRLAQPQRRLERVDQPRALVGSEHEAVDHDLDVVLLVLLERDRLVERRTSRRRPGPGRSPALRMSSSSELVLALAAPDDRPEDHQAGAGRQLLDLVGHLVDRLLGDRAPADRAVRVADAGVEQAEVVVDLGDRADRRARVLGGPLLVDRDGRREALDDVDVGLLHLAQELAGVGGERLDVAPLALGVDGVEGERRLARAATGR